jgi:DNA-binding response OmpR family regulator
MSNETVAVFLHVEQESPDNPSPAASICGRHVLVCGPSLVENAWLLSTLSVAAHGVAVHRSLKEAAKVLERDPAAIALIEATVPRQAELLEVFRRLDHRCQRRVLLIVWRPARRMVRAFIEAGVGDFLTMPAPASEVLLRVELRAREAERWIVAESSESPPVPPEVSQLHRAIGPEMIGLHLSDREFLLYDLLAQRFGTVVPRTEILNRIWGRDSSEAAASNIVDVYVR